MAILMASEHILERLERPDQRPDDPGRELLPHPLPQPVELVELDVEVTQLAGRLLDPAERGAVGRQLSGREHGFQLTLHGPTAAYRDTQVVQELDVEIVDAPLKVRLD